MGLVELVEGASLRPEIQVRQEKIAIYPNDRNVTIDRAAQLTELLELAFGVEALTR